MTSLEIKPNSNLNQPLFPNNEMHTREIDLLSLMDVLWCAKKRILAYVLAFALGGLLLSFLLSQKWTSNAIVTPAESTQWAQLHQHLAALQVLGVNIGIDRNDVFNLFLKKFSSQQNFEEYITSSPVLMAHFKDTNVDTMVLHRAIVAMFEKVKAVNDNAVKKDDSQPYTSWTLSFTGPNPQETQSILNNYIEFVSAKVVAQSLANIRDTVALKVQTEKDVLELERAKLANIQDTRIKRLNYSLQVAKAAGITRPVYSNGQAVKDDPDFSIALGADGIERKLEIEKSITDVAELNDGLRNREYQLSLLEKISVKDMTFPILKYQLPASLPMKKDGPGRGVIIILAALLGGIFACGSILLGQAMAAHHQVFKKVLPEPDN